jgi:DNA-binding response OmpR family regulator
VPLEQLANEVPNVGIVVHDKHSATLHTVSIPDRSDIRARLVDDESVARILICEPHPEVRGLLAHVATRLGHEPSFPGDGESLRFDAEAVDILLIEPADPRALAAAQILRLQREEVPIVCASIYPPSSHTRRLDPVAYIVKPFALGELQDAIGAAVARIRIAA